MTLYPYIYIIYIDVAVQVFGCFFLSGNLTKICLGLGAASIYMVIEFFIIVSFWQTYQKCCKFNQQQMVLLISTNPTGDIKTWNSGTLWKVCFKKVQSTPVQTVIEKDLGTLPHATWILSCWFLARVTSQLSPGFPTCMISLIQLNDMFIKLCEIQLVQFACSSTFFSGEYLPSTT